MIPRYNNLMLMRQRSKPIDLILDFSDRSRVREIASVDEDVARGKRTGFVRVRIGGADEMDSRVGRRPRESGTAEEENEAVKDLGNKLDWGSQDSVGEGRRLEGRRGWFGKGEHCQLEEPIKPKAPSMFGPAS